MVRSNEPAGADARGEKQSWSDGDLTEVTLSSDDWQEVASVQSTSSKKYFPGYGAGNRNDDVGMADFDAEATGGGSATDGDSLNVKFRYAVYNDADKDDLAATGPSFDSDGLRSAVGESLMDKVVAPQQRIGAPEDGKVVLEAKAKDSDANGAILESDDAAHSGTILDVGFPYTEIRG